MHVTSIQENDVKEFVRWNDVMDKVLENSPLAEGKNRATVEDIENNEHVWEIYAGMRVENSNSNLADILTTSLAYSTENYEAKDVKNNFLVDPKKSDVSELDYHGYKLRVYGSKFGEDNTIISMLYLDETHMLRIDYKPEVDAKIGEKSLKEKYDLVESVLEELVKIEK